MLNSVCASSFSTHARVDACPAPPVERGVEGARRPPSRRNAMRPNRTRRPRSTVGFCANRAGRGDPILASLGESGGNSGERINHFLLSNLVAAVFLAMLSECSESPLLASHCILQVLVEWRERPTRPLTGDRLKKPVSEIDNVLQGFSSGALQFVSLGAGLHRRQS